MKSWTKNFLSLFLDSNCPLCQRSTAEEICADCVKQLQRCQLSERDRLKTPSVYAWGAYGGALKRAISMMKYEGQPQIARPLGHALARSWLNSPFFAPNLVVVPIPLHPHKQKERGYNQAALIAQAFSEITGLRIKESALARVRETQAQYILSPSERQRNLAEAFALTPEFRRHPTNIPILLVDDIYTTGATAISAIQTLEKSGISVHGVVAVASTVQTK